MDVIKVGKKKIIVSLFRKRHYQTKKKCGNEQKTMLKKYRCYHLLSLGKKIYIFSHMFLLHTFCDFNGVNNQSQI